MQESDRLAGEGAASADAAAEGVAGCQLDQQPSAAPGDAAARPASSVAGGAAQFTAGPEVSREDMDALLQVCLGA